MASLAQEAKQAGSGVSNDAMKSCCLGEERQGTAGTSLLVTCQMMPKSLWQLQLDAFKQGIGL